MTSIRLIEQPEAKADENVIDAVAGDNENEHGAEAAVEASGIADGRSHTRKQPGGILTAFAGAR